MLPPPPEHPALGAGRPATTPPRRGLVLAAALALGCATTAVVAVRAGDGNRPEPVAESTAIGVPVVSYEPPATISLLPRPSRSSASKVVTAPPPAAERLTHRSSAPARRTTSPAPSRTTAQPPAPPPALAVGATVGLESADRPGYRIRHRDFVGRLDPVDAGSDLDRADSSFTVRAGRANAQCVSLESVNFPGYYLRHYDFAIRLDRSDRTKMFDEDSTFCTGTIRQGTALALRSLNYPARWVVADGNRLVLRETGADGATAFLPRSAL